MPEVQFPWEDPRYEYDHLGSVANTAVEPETRGATEGTLHDTEYIRSHTPAGDPVALRGYAFLREGAALPGWLQALARLQVGGERGYGWGLLVRQECEPVDAPAVFGCELRLDAARPRLR